MDGPIRRCPEWREPAHGVVMVSGYGEAVAVQRDTDQNLSVCNIFSGPWSGIPTGTSSDRAAIAGKIDGERSGFVGVKEERRGKPRSTPVR